MCCACFINFIMKAEKYLRVEHRQMRCSRGSGLYDHFQAAKEFCWNRRLWRHWTLFDEMNYLMAKFKRRGIVQVFQTPDRWVDIPFKPTNLLNSLETGHSYQTIFYDVIIPANTHAHIQCTSNSDLFFCDETMGGVSRSHCSVLIFDVTVIEEKFDWSIVPNHCQRSFSFCDFVEKRWY